MSHSLQRVARTAPGTALALLLGAGCAFGDGEGFATVEPTVQATYAADPTGSSLSVSAIGGFAGGYHNGGFGHGFHGGHGRRFAVGSGLGYGFYPYSYYDDYAYDPYAYYDDGSCYVVKRRVHTSHGWRRQPVEVCG